MQSLDTIEAFRDKNMFSSIGRLKCDGSGISVFGESPSQAVRRLALPKITPFTIYPAPKFSVEGLAIGEPVVPNSSAYHQYVCKPSEQYERFTRCHESHIENGVQISRTILHSSNLIAWYVNKELRRAYFEPSDINNTIKHLASVFHSAPQVYRFNETGYPKAIIATFGDVVLEPLKDQDLAMLAQGKSPHIGVLVDFLDDFGRSAQGHLPVYKLAGGKGFAWIASYDADGKGRLDSLRPMLLR